MGQDKKSFDDILGYIALAVLFLSVATVVFCTVVQTRNTGPTYSTPNGEMPREATYLER